MKKLILGLSLLVPFFAFAQNTGDIKLTTELKSFLDNYTYQVVMFKHGTIIPIMEKQDNPEEFAKGELQKAIENKYGLEFGGTIHNLQNLTGWIVVDYQDIKNYVMVSEGNGAYGIAKNNRKLDARDPQVIYVSQK